MLEFSLLSKWRSRPSPKYRSGVEC